MKKWQLVLLVFSAICAVLWTTRVRSEPARASREMLAQMGAMSPADLSVLKAALERPGSQIVTTAGRANEKLWEPSEA